MMFKSKFLLKSLSLCLTMIIIFTGTSSSFGQKSVQTNSNIDIVSTEEGMFSYETITDDERGQMLIITNLETNKEYTVFKVYESVYLESEGEETLKVATIEENKSKLDIGLYSGWTYFGPDKIIFDLEGITVLAVAAGVIALALGGGPILAVKAALAQLGAGAVFNGVYAMKWGRYRFVGRGVEGEYSSQLYQPNNRKLGPQINWSGKR